MDSTATQSTKRPYRGRLQRPCDACRRRKACCIRDFTESQCSLCKMRGVQCTFVRAPNVRRRNRKTDPVGDETVGSPSLGRRLEQQPEGPPPQLDTPSTTYGEDASPTASREWISQYVGLSGDQDPYMLRHCTLRENRYRHPDFACLRVYGYDWEEPAHFTGVPESHLDPRPDWYPAAPKRSSGSHEAMIDAYWTNIHSAYPLLDPGAISSDVQEIDVPLLGAIYGLARPYASQAVSAEDWDMWPKFMFQALPIEKRCPRLETAEAMLLWLQRPPKVHRAPTMPGLWSEVGSLVGISHVLGLNVNPTGWAIPDSQKRRRIRIANGIYILDKWLALGLGRPSYISSNDWDVPLPDENDFVDLLPAQSQSEDHKFGKQIFISMANLSAILAETLETFYTLRSINRLKYASDTDLLVQLDTFEASLSEYHVRHIARWSHTDEDLAVLDARGTVTLAYYTALTVLYRAVLRHLSTTQEIVLIVRERACSVLLETTRFLSSLTVSQTRAFWWSPISRINFAIIGSFMFSMLLTSTEEDQVEFWVSQIDKYRVLLNLHSPSFDTARMAAKRLELLTCVATGYGEDNRENPWDLNI